MICPKKNEHSACFANSLFFTLMKMFVVIKIVDINRIECQFLLPFGRRPLDEAQQVLVLVIMIRNFIKFLEYTLPLS